MTKLRHLISGIWGAIGATMLLSCNLDDFKLNELAMPVDIVPEVYAPIAYGTFKVKDLMVVAVPDATPIPIGGLSLDPFIMGKTGLNFYSSAVDSFYLLNHFTNDTPINMAFAYNFYDGATGFPLGKTFASGIIPPGVKDTLIQFGLGRVDQDNLQQASNIILRFTPSNVNAAPLTYGMVKNSYFSIKIAFYAPVHVWKLKLQ
jgi:hypothetical protein